MVMDNPKDLESEEGATSCSGMDNNVKECENLSVDHLEDLDSIMQDIDDRLRISRMVNDSVIMGMVGAVQQEAEREMAQRQLEIAALKKMLLSHPEVQQELEFQAQVEAMVVANCIRSLQEQFVGKPWEQNARLHVDYSSHFTKKWKEEFWSFRQELDSLNKLLSGPDAANLVSHGSLGADHLQRKLSGSNISPTTSLREGSDKHEELIISPENLDPAQLKHFNREELVDYFKTEMTKMKRNHESKVQQMTEENFSLKREYLRERGSSLPLRKDRDFDGLKRKISEAIVKLDEISVETKSSLPTLKSEVDGVCSMKEMDALSSENCRLKDILSDEQREVGRLLPDTEKQISFYSQVDMNLLNEIRNLKCELDDAKISASVCEDVQCCFIKGMITDMLSIEDLSMESVISKELTGFLFANSLREARQEFDILSNERENIHRDSLEKELLDKVKLLEFEIAENERLKQEKLLLAGSLEEKDRLAQETARQLAIEKKLAKQELDKLRSHCVDISKELDVVKVDLTRALEQTETYKDELRKLNEELGLVKEELLQNDEERRLLAIGIQQEHDRLLQAEQNERACRKQLELSTSVACGFMEALKDMEDRANKTIKRNNLRLDGLGSELTSLAEEARKHKRWGLMYKQRFERKCSDLEKAENEVDRLADEVEALLRLLENVYVALDHYSPVFEHYNGFKEILKMVKSELVGGI